MTIGVLIEARVRREHRDRFLHATRLYTQRTRLESTRPRVEALELGEGEGYLIRQLYHDEAAADAHAHAEHTLLWLAVVAELVEVPLTVRRVKPVVVEPPPIPRAPRPPALETATELPSTPRAAIEQVTHGAPPLRLPRVQVVVERVEVASAHEGFLRGKPDLCLLVGCYRVSEQEAEVLGRAVYRFELGQTPPCELVRRDRVLDLPVSFEQLPLRVYVAVLAFEENGGSDVRAAYRALSDPSALFFWSSLQDEPNPIALGQHAAQLEPNHCERVQTLTEDAEDDTWVGAASGLVEFKGRGQERLLRCHTQSADGKNDWLWELSLRLA